MVKIQTRDFGELEVKEEQIYTFPNGLFAFEDVHHFALISPLGEGVFPMWLQSTEDVFPCFIVFDPSIIDSNYEVALTPSEERLLRFQGGDGSDMRLLAIAKVPENYHHSTVNMKSPIIINEALKIATQVILPHDYPFRLEIYQDEEASE